MKSYADIYNEATKKALEAAAQIERRVSIKFDLPYSLVDITYVLRHLYEDPVFHDKFVGEQQFQGETRWPKGFCALSSACIYDLYGGADVWDFQTIKIGTWEYAPVVFLRDKLLGLAFDTTGDQFAPFRVPYELGQPIYKQLKTTNKEPFVKRVEQELDKLNYDRKTRTTYSA